MLNFLITPDRATVYNVKGIDAWGRPQKEKELSFPCRVVFNEKRESISVSVGNDVVYTATVSANGRVPLDVGKTVVFTDPEGITHTKEIINRVYKRDLSGEVIMTKAVV